MNETLESSSSRTSIGREGRRSVATSLFGGAILATVATASLTQTTYFPTAAALSIASASGYVVLGGNLAEGDGGGGTFMQGVTVRLRVWCLLRTGECRRTPQRRARRDVRWHMEV